MEPNLAESIYIRSSIKFLHFVPFRQQIWPPRAIRVVHSLVFCVVFCRPLFVLLSLSFGNQCSCLQTTVTDFSLVIFKLFSWTIIVYLYTTHFSRLESGYWRSISVKSNTSCFHCTFNFPLLVLLYIYFYYIFGKQFLNWPPSLHFHHAFQLDYKNF
jgi:hypothetical protein